VRPTEEVYAAIKGRAPLKKLKLLHSSQPAINLGAGELAHIFFSLQMGCETALADEFYFMAVFKIDMTAPCPCIGVRILFDYTDEWLIAMGILNSVSLAVFRAGLHGATVVVVGDYSKRNGRLYTRFGTMQVSSRTSLKVTGLFLLGANKQR
jgi:hypothetical protein